MLCSSLQSSGVNVKVIPVLFDLQIKPKQKWKTPTCPCTSENEHLAADGSKINTYNAVPNWWFIIDFCLVSPDPFLSD